MKDKKQESIFKKEMKRDIATYKRLSGKKKVLFIWDYYKYKIIAAIVICFILITAARLIYEGQQPKRLQVCVVLNEDNISCKGWFKPFFKELQKDGKEGKCLLNEDQPFDFQNKYYYLHEMEVMTTISSRQMDVAICGPDMYEYLLALNACAPLDKVLPENTVKELQERGILLKARANITQKEDGSLDESAAVDGYFAVDLTETAFGKEYNEDQKLEDGQKKEGLYGIIISNTDHMEDSIKLIQTICK